MSRIADRTWTGFCPRKDCCCYVPDRGVCDEYKVGGRWRCAECGWPSEVHDPRDVMAAAGLKLLISAERES